MSRIAFCLMVAVALSACGAYEAVDDQVNKLFGPSCPSPRAMPPCPRP